jgi:acetyltransferase-like isoleucine patch superfamily enzyme
MGFIRKRIINWLCSLGFIHDSRIRIRGPKERLTYPDGIRGLSILFNTMSGRITVGHNVVFGHSVMVLTGKHLFSDGNYKDIQESGNDIVIRDGC